jgi:hypothetical protein
MRPYILERDAKDKFCPATKCLCEGSKCMMWQWSDCDQEVERRKTDPRSTKNESKLQSAVIPIKGRCIL